MAGAEVLGPIPWQHTRKSPWRMRLVTGRWRPGSIAMDGGGSDFDGQRGRLAKRIHQGTAFGLGFRAIVGAVCQHGFRLEKHV